MAPLYEKFCPQNLKSTVDRLLVTLPHSVKVLTVGLVEVQRGFLRVGQFEHRLPHVVNCCGVFIHGFREFLVSSSNCLCQLEHCGRVIIDRNEQVDMPGDDVLDEVLQLIRLTLCNVPGAR